MNKPIAASCLMLVWIVTIASAAETKNVDGKFPPPKPPELKWVELLSGKLDDHWCDMNCTLAGSFKLIRDEKGEAVLAGSGHPIGLVRSLRPYENFILEVDWRHLTEAPNSSTPDASGSSGNSGLYVWADPIPPLGNSFTRAIEIQVCNLGNGQWYTSHGDLFPIHGATMIADPRFGVSGSRSMPTEFRGSKTGEWNHCRLTCVDGAIQQELNGALVTAGFRSSPRKGYLCLESEGGPVEFKHMRLTELKGDLGLKPEQVSLTLPAGVRTTCLFNGLNMDGWTTGNGAKGEWSVDDRLLVSAGKSNGEVTRSLPAKDFTLIFDWENVGAGGNLAAPFTIDGVGLTEPIAGDAVKAKGWNRVEAKIIEGKISITVNGKVAVAERTLPAQNKTPPRSLRLTAQSHAIHFCNIMSIEVTATRQ